MAYQTGTASGITDLLDKLNTFATANGWTLRRREAATLSISKGAVYQNLQESGSAINLHASRGFDAGLAWNNQPDYAAVIQSCTNLSGSFSAYHFFADQDYLHVVIEVDPGLYRHIAFGDIEKSSGYTGGQYSCATRIDGGIWHTSLFSSGLHYGAGYYNLHPAVGGPSSFYVDVDSVAKHQLLTSGGLPGGFVRMITSEMFYSASMLYADWPNCMPNTLNGMTGHIPVQIFVQRTGGLYSPLGYVRDLRIVNMVNIRPGEQRTIGADEWLYFPVLAKGGPSGNWGYAYKIIP
jgi:hypothetical protein